jgi:hypothetical protein
VVIEKAEIFGGVTPNEETDIYAVGAVAIRISGAVVRHLWQGIPGYFLTNDPIQNYDRPIEAMWGLTFGLAWPTRPKFR